MMKKQLTKSDLLDLKNSTSSKVVRTLVSTILGELDRVTKNPDPFQIGQVIKKMYESDLQCYDTGKADQSITEEINFLKEYLPEMMTDEDIIHFIESQNPETYKTLGDYMKLFQICHKGLYDGKRATELVKQHLSKR